MKFALVVGSTYPVTNRVLENCVILIYTTSRTNMDALLNVLTLLFPPSPKPLADNLSQSSSCGVAIRRSKLSERARLTGLAISQNSLLYKYFALLLPPKGRLPWLSLLLDMTAMRQ